MLSSVLCISSVATPIIQMGALLLRLLTWVRLWRSKFGEGDTSAVKEAFGENLESEPNLTVESREEITLPVLKVNPHQISGGTPDARQVGKTAHYIIYSLSSNPALSGPDVSTCHK